MYSYPIAESTIGAEEQAAMLKCLIARQTTMGPRVREFEEKFAEYIGVPEAVMVNSGASANLLIMLAARQLGTLKRGAEVLVPAVTWPTQVHAVIQAGFEPRFVDVNVNTLQVTPEALEAAITPATKAISLVHLCGNPCDMGAIMDIAKRHDLLVFEDCCEALGASFNNQRVGSFGMASAFSFYQSHHICTMEGGMVGTWHRGFSEALRGLRAHGWARDLKYRRQLDPKADRFLFLTMGFNFRALELSGACGLVQLDKLDGFNRRRLSNYTVLHDAMADVVEPLLPTSPLSSPAWMMVPFVLKPELKMSRDEACEYLDTLGIETRPIVGGNLLRQPAFDSWRMDLPSYVGANAIHDRGFYIGLHPLEEDLTRAVAALTQLRTKL